MNVMKPLLPTADELAPYIDKMNESGHYSNFGPINNILESRLTQIFNKPIVTASSGTTALEVAIASHYLPVNSYILVPALTYIATATAVRRCGHRVLVSDIDLDHWILTPARARDLVNKYPGEIKMVIPVATFGHTLPADEWSEFSKETGIPVVMDCAQAFGSQPDVGTCTAMFSMHATKALPAGEGGFIVTTPELEGIQRSMTSFGQNLGRSTTDRMLVVEDYGTNAKLSELHASVANIMLDRWPTRLQQFRMQLNAYQDLLEYQFGDSPFGEQMRFQVGCRDYIRQMFVVQFESQLVRDRVAKHLADKGIQTKRPYQPLVNKHPGFASVDAEPTTNAELIAGQTLTIPFWLEMSRDDMQTVCNAIAEVL
jgi:dTDP-4-amino-4,6-dideoxygalactose transaminase